MNTQILARPTDKAILEPDWYDDKKRVFDPQTGITTVKLFSGDCYLSTQPNEMLVTILGSCIAACIRDPIAGIGGMNHFLLPGDGDTTQQGQAARYGAYAMEKLINEIIKAGGRKSRLEAKIFGGGNVIRNSAQIGSKNAAFVRGFLARENIFVASEDLEGNQPRRIHYYPDTGRVRVRKLASTIDDGIVKREKAYMASLQTPAEGEVDLF